MRRRVDKPVCIGPTVIGFLCFTKFGIRPVLSTGELLDKNYTDEASAEAALTECTVTDDDGGVLGFATGGSAFVLDRSEAINSWGGRVRKLGEYSSQEAAAEAIRAA